MEGGNNSRPAEWECESQRLAAYDVIYCLNHILVSFNLRGGEVTSTNSYILLKLFWKTPKKNFQDSFTGKK